MLNLLIYFLCQVGTALACYSYHQVPHIFQTRCFQEKAEWHLMWKEGVYHTSCDKENHTQSYKTWERVKLKISPEGGN